MDIQRQIVGEMEAFSLKRASEIANAIQKGENPLALKKMMELHAELFRKWLVAYYHTDLESDEMIGLIFAAEFIRMTIECTLNSVRFETWKDGVPT